MNRLPALPAELTIYAVAELHRSWLTALSGSDPDVRVLAVDASAVCDADGAGLQLLLSLRQHCRVHDQVLHLERPSTVLAEHAQALGLHALLAQPDTTETAA